MTWLSEPNGPGTYLWRSSDDSQEVFSLNVVDSGVSLRLENGSYLPRGRWLPISMIVTETGRIGNIDDCVINAWNRLAVIDQRLAKLENKQGDISEKTESASPRLPIGTPEKPLMPPTGTLRELVERWRKHAVNHTVLLNESEDRGNQMQNAGFVYAYRECATVLESTIAALEPSEDELLKIIQNYIGNHVNADIAGIAFRAGVNWMMKRIKTPSA